MWRYSGALERQNARTSAVAQRDSAGRLDSMGGEVGRTTEWYYCLKHHTVEVRENCQAKNRLGPYPSPEAASHALESVREREEQIDAEDRAWRGEETADES